MGEAQTGVILLHGLALMRWSMWPLAVFLRRRGYTVINVGYPSRSRPLEALAQSAIAPAVAQLRREGVGTIHFITHSMGGILLRCYLAAQSLPEPGRVVMLCPPNQGSELVDFFHRYKLFRWYFGPAGCQLGTGETELPSQLGPLPRPVGIIAGNRPETRVFSRFFPGANDGKVSVARAQMPGMNDLLILPYGHFSMLFHHVVAEQAVAFLEEGRFSR